MTIQDGCQPPIMVTSCILSLASNVEPQTHLPLAHRLIGQLGEMTLSEVTICNNESEQSLPVYHNQIAYLRLFEPTNYLTLTQTTKVFEQQGNRSDYEKPLVTLDIDIVAIEVSECKQWNDRGLHCPIDDKGKPFINFKALPNWLGIARRFPLASYDKLGMTSLVNNKTVRLNFVNKILLSNQP